MRRRPRCEALPDTSATDRLVRAADSTDGARVVPPRMTHAADRPRLLAIVGPTASGKSALGVALAERLGGEVVSCDSTAVYRGFDIGTDKVPASLRRGIPHHLVDVADPTELYSAARYAREASTAVRTITAAGRVPIVVGGSGLYYRALTRGLFPRARPGRGIASAADADCAPAWSRAVAPVGCGGRLSIRGSDSSARREASRTCARGLRPHSTPPDRAFSGDSFSRSRDTM